MNDQVTAQPIIDRLAHCLGLRAIAQQLQVATGTHPLILADSCPNGESWNSRL